MSGNGMKILVTGSAGFIAGYLVEELLEHGYNVVLSNDRPGDRGHRDPRFTSRRVDRHPRTDESTGEDRVRHVPQWECPAGHRREDTDIG